MIYSSIYLNTDNDRLVKQITGMIYMPRVHIDQNILKWKVKQRLKQADRKTENYNWKIDRASSVCVTVNSVGLRSHSLRLFGPERPQAASSGSL